MGEKADEKIWSPQDLRNASTTWNLAGDKKLLQMLENMHKDFVEKTEHTSGKLDTLLVDLEKTSLSLKNVNNRFTGLSDTQFVEHRVQEDEAEIINVPDKETRKLIINPSETSAIKEKEKEEAARREISLEKVATSLIRLEDLCETFDITPDTDSESDDETSDDGAQLSMLRAKNIYADRPLPYVIGSIEWRNKDHIGLDCDSEDADDGDRKQTEIEEEYSSTDNDDEEESTNNSFDEGRTVQEKKRQMTLPIQNKINIADHNASSVTSTSTNNSTDTTDSEISKINPGQTFSENISSKRNLTHDTLGADSTQAERPQKLPPVKISNASDFAAELARKLGSTVPPKTGAAAKENVQSRKETGNIASAKNKHQNFDPGLSKQPDKRVTGNVFLDEPPPMESDMFNEEKDDFFGNDRNEDDDEEFISGGLFSDKPKQPVKSSSLFGQKKSSNYDGLFDNPPDDGNNFNDGVIRNKNFMKNPAKGANDGLFDARSDDPKKKSRGLFDDFDDDDFADFKVNNDSKSGSKSLFDDSNKPKKSITKVSSNMQQDAMIIKKDVAKEKILFGDDEDDDASSLFGGRKISESTAKTDSKNITKRELRSEKPEISSRSVTAEVVDKTPKPPPAKKDSLFGDMDDGDDDDDIFASLKKSNISKSKVSTASKQTAPANIGGVLKNASSKPKGLFDNDSDGEDLFSSLKMPAKRGTAVHNSDKIVKNEDDLFESSIKKPSATASKIGVNPETVEHTESIADVLKSKRRRDSTGSESDDLTEERTKFDNHKTADGFEDLESKFPPSDKIEKSTNVENKQYNVESHDTKEKMKVSPKPELNQTNLNKTLITIDSSELPPKTDKPAISKTKPTIQNVKIVDTADKVIGDNILKNNHSDDAHFKNRNVKVNEDSVAKTITNNKTNISHYENENLISEKSSPHLEEATKRSNSLFDDFPPPLDVTESSAKDIKDVNSLFDDEDDNNDDDLFSKFRTKIVKDDKPSMGLFDDLSPNIDDLANKKSASIDLFSDEPPELDDSILSESKDEGASNMFADYPYYKTVNVIKSSAGTAAEESNSPEKNSSHTSIPSESTPESFLSKPDIVSIKPNFVPAKPIIESKVKPEVAGVKPKIESNKPSSGQIITVSNKEDLPIASEMNANSIENTEREIDSKAKSKTDTFKSESVALFKGLHESKKDNAGFEQKEKTAEAISPTRTIGKLQKSNFNINVKALIPGSAPKLVKEISEEVNAVNKASSIKTESELDVDLFNKNEDKSDEATNQIDSSSFQNLAKDFGTDQVDRRAPMIASDPMKSVSFDGEPSPGSDVVLSNTASKERVKIQVKRRPSSRRARQEAIRKSAIDVTIPDDVKDKNYNDFTISLPTSPIRDKSISGEQYNHVGDRRDNDSLTSTDINNKEIAITTIDRAYNIDGKEENKLSNRRDLFDSLSSTLDNQLFSTVGENSRVDSLDIFKKDLTVVKSKASGETHSEDDQLFSVSKKTSTEKITVPANEKKLKKSRDLTETKQVLNNKDTLPSKKTPLNLFSDLDDDVDLFASVKKNKMKGSLFGGNFEDDNVDIFASQKSKPVSSESSTGAVKKKNTPHAKKGNVFDDLDDDASDLFSPKVKSVAVKTNGDPKIVKDTDSKAKSLFGDKLKIEDGSENDLFFTPSKSKSDKPSSLFGEDDDDDFDIFNPRKRPLGKQTKSTDITVAKSSTAVKQHSATLSSAEVTIRDPLSSFLDD